MCLTTSTVIYSATVSGKTSFASVKMETKTKVMWVESSSGDFFAESLLESPVSLTDKAAILACDLFSTEYNQQNKQEIILLVADCCVGTWTAPNVPAAALFCFVCLFASCCINGFYITFIIQRKYEKDHSGCVDAKVVLWGNLPA